MRCLATAPLLALLATATPALELNIEGLPFVFEHRWGERDDGTQFDRWSALARLYSSERITAPDGTVGLRWWIAPLFEYTGNVDGFTEWSMLWPAPLLRHRWRTMGEPEQSEWVALLWLYRWKSVLRASGVHDLDWWLIPLFWHETQVDGDFKWSLLWPFSLLTHRVDSLDNGGTVSEWNGPLWLWHWWRRSGAPEHNRLEWWLMPLFRWESTPGEMGRREWWAPFPLPLASLGRDPERHRWHTYIFPWFTHRRGEDPATDGRRGHGVIPFYIRNETHQSHSDGSTLWAFPYFENQSRQRDGSGSRRFQSLFPWFRGRRDWRDSKLGTMHTQDDWGVLPVTWGWEDSRFSHLHVWPLLLWRPEEHLFAAPILFMGETYTFIVPIYGRLEDDASRWDPLTEASVPQTEEMEFFLFPLWLRYQTFEEGERVGARQLALWPLIGWSEGPLSGGRAGRWREEGRSGHHRFLPLWLHMWHESETHRETRTSILPPLIWRMRDYHEDTLREAFDIGFPFYWRRREFSDSGMPTEALDILAPLWARYRGWQGENQLDDRLDIVFPLWLRWRDWVGEELTNAADVVFPLWWDFHNIWRDRRQRGLVPLFWQEQIQGQTRRLSILWPLLQLRWPDPTAAAAEDPEFALRFGWVLGGYERWADGDVLVDLLGGPLWQRDVEAEQTHIRLLWKLYARDTDAAEETNRVSVLGGLYERTREEDDHALRLLWLPWRIPLP
jgi:hypothetical protein